MTEGRFTLFIEVESFVYLVRPSYICLLYRRSEKDSSFRSVCVPRWATNSNPIPLICVLVRQNRMRHKPNHSVLLCASWYALVNKDIYAAQTHTHIRTHTGGMVRIYGICTYASQVYTVYNRFSYYIEHRRIDRVWVPPVDYSTDDPTGHPFSHPPTAPLHHPLLYNTPIRIRTCIKCIDRFGLRERESEKVGDVDGFSIKRT